MRWFLCILMFALAWPIMVAAQDDGEDESRLTRFLEEQLSGAEGITVDLQGFTGALSSTARLDRMIISDAEGPWLILENASLNWRRTALVRGRLEIRHLTAERLEIIRPPVRDTGLNLPDAQARPFALPELPVEIDIGELAIERVVLGAEVLGLPAELSLAGSADLGDGSGQADFRITRLDGPRGVFSLQTAYSNATSILTLNLQLDEDPGGLLVELATIPDRPAVSMSLEGTGPVTEFNADFTLATDGSPRLTGGVGIAAGPDPDDRVVSFSLGGDLRPLFEAEYREFFGAQTAFAGRVTLFADGRLAVDNIALETAELSLTGTVAMRADGQPDVIDVEGRIADQSGARVRLPVPGDVFVQAATIDIGFDSKQGSAYRAAFDVDEFDAETIEIDTLSLTAFGTITQDPGGVSAVTATISLESGGLDHADPDLAIALGTEQALSANLSWFEGAPLFLTQLVINAGDLALSGTAALDIDGGAADLTMDVQAQAPDLTRFAPATDAPLRGSLSGQLAGRVDLLSGAFDLRLEGLGQNLRLVDGIPPELLAGETRLVLDAARDETGLTLDTLSIVTAELSLDGSGRADNSDGTFAATLRLDDVGLFTNVINGPVTGTVRLDRSDAGPWRTQADLRGPANINVSLDGRLGLEGGTVDLQASGSVPLELLNRYIAPYNLRGTLAFDLALRGQPRLANLTGTLRASGARAALPTLNTALEGLSLDARIGGGAINAEITGLVSTGGRVTVTTRADIATPGIPLRAELTGRELRLVDPTLYEIMLSDASLIFSGSVTGRSTLSGRVAIAEAEFIVPDRGLGTADIPPILHFNETLPERQTRLAAGLGPSVGGRVGPSSNMASRTTVDITISAPSRIFVRGRGLDAELGGEVRFGGTIANPVPNGQVDLIRGRWTILGIRLDLDQGSVTLQGDFDPLINLRASSQSGRYTIQIALVGPVSDPGVTLSSDPILPEDEILAQLLFGRSISALSPIQLLRLADTAAGLAGGSTNGGVFATLRDDLGLDDLDIQTDDQGGLEVRAGRYLSENVYSDVTIGTDGQTDLSLNIDLTGDFTARGTFSTDGASSIGLFYERDY